MRITAWAALLLVFPAFLVLAQDKVQVHVDKEPMSRGKYIVDHVAMCIQCHTPRDQKGDLLLSQYLMGAPVVVDAPPYAEKWALKAPPIAGFLGYSKDQGLRLLMDGITRHGRAPNPPMPPFRMNREDAEAVVAYLQSLK